jgi:hypothetical protein
MIEQHATRFTIGRLAHAANIPVSTIRYYERVGLLPAGIRSSSNYRLFGEHATNRVHPRGAVGRISAPRRCVSPRCASEWARAMP